MSTNGWKALFDPETKRYYYVNLTTNESTWKNMSAVPTPAPVVPVPVPIPAPAPAPVSASPPKPTRTIFSTTLTTPSFAPTSKFSSISITPYSSSNYTFTITTHFSTPFVSPSISNSTSTTPRTSISITKSIYDFLLLYQKLVFEHPGQCVPVLFPRISNIVSFVDDSLLMSSSMDVDKVSEILWRWLMEVATG